MMFLKHTFFHGANEVSTYGTVDKIGMIYIKLHSICGLRTEIFIRAYEWIEPIIVAELMCIWIQLYCYWDSFRHTAYAEREYVG